MSDDPAAEQQLPLQADPVVSDNDDDDDDGNSSRCSTTVLQMDSGEILPAGELVPQLEQEPLHELGSVAPSISHALVGAVAMPHGDAGANAYLDANTEQWTEH